MGGERGPETSPEVAGGGEQSHVDPQTPTEHAQYDSATAGEGQQGDQSGSQSGGDNSGEGQGEG